MTTMPSNPRLVLDKRCVERDENFDSLSPLSGRNDDYIQQFLRNDTPRQLKELGEIECIGRVMCTGRKIA